MSAPAPFSRVACAALTGAALDGMLLALAWQGALGAAPLLTAHLALTALAAWWLAREGTDRAAALLLALGLLLAGPFGAALALAVTLRERWSPARRDDLDRWHRRLSGAREESPAERIEREIRDGRAFAPGHRPPPRFAAVLREGSVADRQAVLGLLVKGRVEAPPELLALGLRSADVAVRASAAAAVAKLREGASNAGGSR